MFPLNPKAYYNEEPTGTGVILGSLSINNTTKVVKQWDGANWNTIIIAGAGLVMDGALALVIYDTGTNTYLCESAPGTAVATAAWRIAQVNNSTNQIKWCDGNGNFD